MADSSSDKRSGLCLVLLMGLPAAGKTTFAHKFVQEFTKLNYNVIHVHYDDFIDHTEQANLAELAREETHAKSERSLAQNEEHLAQIDEKSTQSNENLGLNGDKSSESEIILSKWKSRRKEIVDGVQRFFQNFTRNSDNDDVTRSEIDLKMMDKLNTFS